MTATTDSLNDLFYVRCDLVRAIRAVGGNPAGLDDFVRGTLPPALRDRWVTSGVSRPEVGDPGRRRLVTTWESTR